MKRSFFLIWILGIQSPLLFAQSTSLFETAKTAFEDGFYLQAHDQFAAYLLQNPQQSLSPEAAFYQAESLFRQGKIEESMPLFERMTNQFQGNALNIKAWLRMSQFDLDKGFWDRAISTSDKILRQSTLIDEAAEALFIQGKAYFGLKNDIKALQTLIDLKEQFPKSKFAPQALYLMGNILEQKNQNDALQAYLDILENYPQDIASTHAASRLFQLYYDTKQYDTLLNKAPTLLRFIPSTHKDKSTLLLADVSFRQNRWAEAERYYTDLTLKSASLGLQNEAKFGLGQVALKQQNWDRANLFFMELFELEQNDLTPQALYYSAQAHKNKGDTDKALKLLYQLSEQENAPLSLKKQALKEGGHLAYQAQNYDQTVTFLIQYLDKPLALNQVQEGFILADAFVQINDAPSALALWKSLFELPSSAETKFMAGMRIAAEAEKAKNLQEAQYYYEKVAALEGRADVLLKLSEVQRQNNQNDAARRTLQQLTQRYPNAIEAKTAPYLLGWLDFETKNYESSARYFARYLELHRNSPNNLFKTDAQLRLGDSYFALRQFDNAARAFRSAGSLGAAYAKFQEAKALQATRKFEEAQQSYQNFIPEFPTSDFVPEAWFQIGNIHLLEQRNIEAVAAFSQITKNHAFSPFAPKALYGIGSATFNLKDYEQAFQAFQSVLERYPTSTLAKEAVDALQESAVMMNKPALAESFIQDYLNRHPESSIGGESRLKTAEYYFNSGNYEEALPRFDAFIKVNRQPELLPKALSLAAASAIALQKPEIAESYLLTLYHLSPSQTDYRSQLFSFYKSQQKWQEALKLLQELPPQQRNPLEEADLFLQMGRFAEALESTQKCVRAIDEAFRFDCLMLEADILAAQHLWKDAGEKYRYLAGLGDEPKLAQAQFKFAEMLLAQNKVLEARSAFALIPDRFPEAQNWVEKSYLAQAKCYHILGQTPDAQQACKILIEYFPNSPLLAEAQKCQF